MVELLLAGVLFALFVVGRSLDSIEKLLRQIAHNTNQNREWDELPPFPGTITKD